MSVGFDTYFDLHTKIGEKSDMTKSWALCFAACHKQELFVAQELINKVNQSVAELRIVKDKNYNCIKINIMENVKGHSPDLRI